MSQLVIFVCHQLNYKHILYTQSTVHEQTLVNLNLCLTCVVNYQKHGVTIERHTTVQSAILHGEFCQLALAWLA